MVAPSSCRKACKRIDVLAAAQLERVVVEADIADAVLVLAALGIGRADPEPRLAVGPADRVVVFVRDLEAEELEQPAVEGLRLLVVADPDHQVIDPDDAHHAVLRSSRTDHCHTARRTYCPLSVARRRRVPTALRLASVGHHASVPSLSARRRCAYLGDMSEQRDTEPTVGQEDAKRPVPKPMPKEIGGPAGPEPTRYGDWEVNGRCSDF